MGLPHCSLKKMVFFSPHTRANTGDCLLQVTIVLKYFFQFGFFPFNQKLEVERSKPFHPPNILGVEKKEGYVLYDMLQLLALFYHRAILKVNMLSGAAAATVPKKNTTSPPRSKTTAT